MPTHFKIMGFWGFGASLSPPSASDPPFPPVAPRSPTPPSSPPSSPPVPELFPFLDLLSSHAAALSRMPPERWGVFGTGATSLEEEEEVEGEDLLAFWGGRGVSEVVAVCGSSRVEEGAGVGVGWGVG